MRRQVRRGQGIPVGLYHLDLAAQKLLVEPEGGFAVAAEKEVGTPLHRGLLGYPECLTAAKFYRFPSRARAQAPPYIPG